MIVRALTAADRDAWLRMRHALWPEDADHHAREIDAHFAGEPSPFQIAQVFVAERENGGLCGFAEAGLRPFADACEEAPCAYLEGLYVDADMRRTGVARALVAAVEDWARAEGHHELGSDYLIDNDASAGWHAAHGFEVVERLVMVRKKLLP
ncbi:MAG TPA: GNAT family N-acetyltransferase [Caulobacteraceae bacterium]|nr:GNAT family N-acetyltransferase [Caulobacteraceae bacterium]